MTADRTRTRLAVCTLFAVLAAHYARWATLTRPIHADFGQVWFAARAVLHRVDPYAMIGPGMPFEWEAPLFYPLPAALIGLPFTPFSESTAVALFVAIGMFAFAWALTEHGYGMLWAIASICTHQAVQIAQWSPLLAGALVFPPLSAILIAKPTIGAAVFAARPSWWAVGGAVALIALSFILQPHWMESWHQALGAASVGAGKPFPYIAPVTFPGGVVALLALTRWRRPEARLLAVLACVPQTTLPYEGVLLFFIPRGWRQALLLCALSWAMLVFVRVVYEPIGLTQTIDAYGPMMTVFMYLPATIMVLRRKNEGAIADWLVPAITALHQRFVFGRRVQALARHVAEMIPSSAISVLDVGCGDGTLARDVMAHRPDLIITGLEVQARPTTAIPVNVFNGQTIPLPDQSVDVVMFVDVLHHAGDPHALLHEAARVARQAVIVKDHLADPWLGYVRLGMMDYAGNAGHGVSLRTVYRTRDAWAVTFKGATLVERERRTQLGLYPWPIRWLFERGLHFVSRLEPARA